MEMHKVDTSNQYHKTFCPYFGLTSPQYPKTVSPLMKPVPRQIQDQRHNPHLHCSLTSKRHDVSLKLNFQPHWGTQTHIFSEILGFQYYKYCIVIYIFI